MIKFKKNWIEPIHQSLPIEIAEIFPRHPYLAQALYTRGIKNKEQAQSFFNVDSFHPASAYDFKDIDKAVERIMLSINKNEKIGVWGDFDVDGQTSTALLVSLLRNLGAHVDFHIPIRASESHGINPKNLAEFIQKGINLLISCDTGISAVDAVNLAKRHCVDVIITDHHSLTGELPPAFAIINPNLLPDGHPLNSLSGVGTAFQLAKALTEAVNDKSSIDAFLDLVALGTIADLAFLNSENRNLVQKGLLQLINNRRKGLKELLKLAEVEAENLTEEQISFVIAPRLNAIGRLEDANPIVEFLTTEDDVRAHELALNLEKLNFRRKLAVDSVYKASIHQLEKNPAFMDQPILVLADANWEMGVNGIVASRLVNQFFKPALVITKGSDGIAHGSARSIAGINIFSLISEIKELLLNYGGHPMAAGFSLKSELIDQFRNRINFAYKNTVGSIPIQNDLVIDAFLSFDSLDLLLAEEVEKIAPFGPGNPRIVFAAHKSRILTYSEIGKNKEHLKIKVQDSTGTTKELIWWQSDTSMLPQWEFDLAFSIRAQNFQGKRNIQLEWVDWREPVQEITPFDFLPFCIHDHRIDSENDFIKIITSFKTSELVIWGEGVTLPQLLFINRTKLFPADKLVILTIPPAREILKKALEQVRPKEIWLGGINCGMDDSRIFLNRLIGLLKYSLSAKNGIIEIDLLAALTSQTPAVVEAGIKLVEAQGFITIEDRNEKQLKIGIGGHSDKISEKTINNQLNNLLQENKAFRRFYLSSDPIQLLNI